MSSLVGITQAYATAYAVTYNIDDCLLRLVGNLTLREVVLTQAERMLIEASIGQLHEIRLALKTLTPNIEVSTGE